MNETDCAIEAITGGGSWSRFKTWDAFASAWESFVSQCSSGYDMNIYEYENDLSVRSEIQRLIEDPRLQNTDQYGELSDRIQRADADFKDLLQDDLCIGSSHSPWWERGVLKEACAELAEDFMSIHGIRVRSL